MDFNEYQIEAGKTAIYPNRGSNLLYTVLGLGGETGELVEKLLNIYERVIEDDVSVFDANLYDVLSEFVESAQRLERIKKVIRDNNNARLVEIAGDIQKTITPDDHDFLTKESGDIKWYSSQVDFELGVKSADVAQWNLNKLKSRQDRNKLKGSGDNR